MAWAYYGDLRSKVGANMRFLDEWFRTVPAGHLISRAWVKSRNARTGWAVVAVESFKISRGVPSYTTLYVEIRENPKWVIQRN